MRLREQWSLLAMCSAAAVASAATVFAVDHYGIFQITSHSDNQLSQDPTPAAPRDARLIPTPQNKPEPEAERPPETQVAGLRLNDLPAGELPAEETTNPAAHTADREPSAETSQRVEPVERETPEWWPAEIRRDAPLLTRAPQLAARATPRLPWLMPALGPQSRDKRLIARLSEISPAAEKRLADKFIAAQASWPPADIGLVAIKDEKVLELHARAPGGSWTFVHRYPVLAASGNAGPKLRQGDLQVPEGVYGISFLNPDSRFHVSLRVNYPNTFDRQMAAKDGRSNLGGDIMIHGKNVSTGCLAVGDDAAEELFVLAARIGLTNIKLIIAPTDFRRDGTPLSAPGQPQWLPGLYTQVASSMSEFKRPPSNSLLSFFGQ